MVRWNTLYEEYYYRELEQSKYNALEKIRLLAEYMLSTSTKGGQTFQRIAISSGMRDKLLAEKISKADATITKILQDILTDGQEQGSITTNYAVSELVRMIYVVLEGISLRWAGSYDNRTLEESAGNVIDLLIDLLKF